MRQDTSLFGVPIEGSVDDGHAPSAPLGRGRFNRLTVLVVLGSGLALVLLVAMIVVVSGRGGAPASALVAAGRTPRASSTSAAGQTASSTTVAQRAADARNPFVEVAGLSGTSGSTTAGPPTTTVTATVTATSTVTKHVTVTKTTASSALYLGLYGFQDDGRADFRVNDAQYLQVAGETFATYFKYTAKKTVGTEGCAQVLYGDVKQTICPGEVRRMK